MNETPQPQPDNRINRREFWKLAGVLTLAGGLYALEWKNRWVTTFTQRIEDTLEQQPRVPEGLEKQEGLVMKLEDEGKDQVYLYHERDVKGRMLVRFGRNLPGASAQRFRIEVYKGEIMEWPVSAWEEGEFAGSSRISEPVTNWEILRFHEDKFQNHGKGLVRVNSVGRIGEWDTERSSADPVDVALPIIIKVDGKGGWRYDWSRTLNDGITWQYHPKAPNLWRY